MASPFGERPEAPLGSGFLDLEPSPSIEQPAAVPPALRLGFASSAHDLPPPAAQHGGDSAGAQPPQQPGPKLTITLQPLQALHRPACLARVQALLAGATGQAGERQQQEAGRLRQRVLHAINRMQSPAARALAKAEQALKKPPLASIHVEVSEAQSDGPNSVFSCARCM